MLLKKRENPLPAGEFFVTQLLVLACDGRVVGNVENMLPLFPGQGDTQIPIPFPKERGRKDSRQAKQHFVNRGNHMS